MKPLEPGSFEYYLNQVWLGPTWVPVWWLPFYETAVSALLLFLVCMAVRWAFPKLAAVAATTTKEALMQPLFALLIVVGLFVIVVLFPFLPYNTFGQDIKEVKENGLVIIKLLGIIMAVYTASISIFDEIEGRTAVTLLSKPVSRKEFVLGKLWGIIVPLAILFLILGCVFLLMIAYKVGFDARENSVQNFNDDMRIREMTQIMPGLLMGFFEAVMMTSISVAISTRLPMIPNILICATCWTLGHITTTLVEAGGTMSEPVRFVAQLMSVMLPNLDIFSIEAAVVTERRVPFALLFWSGIYCLLYTTTMSLLALFLFEDRDLA